MAAAARSELLAPAQALATSDEPHCRGGSPRRHLEYGSHGRETAAGAASRPDADALGEGCGGRDRGSRVV